SSPDPQHNSAENVSVFYSLMRLRYLCERVNCRDRNLQTRFFYRAVKSCEMFRTRDCIVRPDPNFRTLARRRLNAVGKCNATAWSHLIEQLFQGFAARERQRDIDAVGCERAQLIARILPVQINDAIDAKFFQQCNPSATTRRPDHPCAMSFGKLHRESSDGTSRAENQKRCAATHAQMILDSLQCRQAGNGRRAGVKQIKALWHGRDMLPMDRYKFGVEASFRIDEFVGPNAVANFETRRARSFLRDNARAVRSKNEWKFRSSLRPPATANVRIPNSNAGSMQSDQHFACARFRNWNSL